MSESDNTDETTIENPWQRRDREERERAERVLREAEQRRRDKYRQEEEADRRQLNAHIAEDEATGKRPRKSHLEDNDAYKARLDAWFASPAGVEAVAQERALVASAKQAEMRLKWSDTVEKFGVPLDMAALLRSETLKTTDATAEVKRGTWSILVLAGKVGVGKSVAAAAWLLDGHIPSPGPDTPENTWTGRDWRYWVHKAQGATEWLAGPKPDPLWVSASRLARWERYDDKAMDKLLKAPKLVIDDLYAEFNDAKGNFQTILDEVVADRLANGRPLLITTNASIDAFKTRYGERIADRIREHGRFVSFAGKSLRGKPSGDPAK